MVFGLFKPNIEKMKRKRDVDGLIKLLEHNDLELQTKAALALGEIGNLRAVMPLLKLMQYEEPDLLIVASSALNKFNKTVLVKPFIDALNDKNSGLMVWRFVAYALGEIGDPRAVEPLINKINVVDSFLSTVSAEALVKIGKPAVLPLINKLKDKNDDIVNESINILCLIGDPQTLEPLKKIELQTKNVYVSLRARRAIKHLEQ